MLASDKKLDNEIPVGENPEKRAYVRGMFAAIAPRYDLCNHLLSLNLDKRWRRLAVDSLDWRREPSGTYLDSCAGTMDLAITLARQEGFTGSIVAADFVLPMLILGREKAPETAPVNADALNLPFPPDHFAGMTVGFGVRNLVDLDQGFREAARVLKSGARLVVLELSTPPRQPLRSLYHLYFRKILPFAGRIVSKHTNAYTYLPESVMAFPDAPNLARRMEQCGFSDVGYRLLMGGICAIHYGTKA